MKIYFLFSNVKNEYICKYIYTNEDKKIYSYSFDEGYIVKNEEPLIKSLKQLKEDFDAKLKTPAKSVNPMVLEHKEFSDVKESLYFLNGSLNNFKYDISARKRLPEIISPYDFDFDEEEEDTETMSEAGFGKKAKPDDDMDVFDDADSDDVDFYNDIMDDDKHDHFKDDDDDNY
ncbi:MAG: hypothetical protein WCJ01_08125 [Ignavibacteria bacterium]